MTLSLEKYRRIPGNKERIAFVDLAKCIALCWVIWNHTEAGYMTQPFDNIILPVFWVCSGYTSRGEFRLMPKCRLIGYYFFLSAICLLFCAFQFGKEITSLDIWGVLYARFCIFDSPLSSTNPVLLSSMNSPLWFLPSMFTSFCVYKIIMTGRSFRMQFIYCVLSLIIATILDFLPILLPWSLDSAFVFAVFICVGRWLRKSDLISQSNLATTMVVLIVYLCLDRFTWLTNPSLRDYGMHWPSYIVTASFGVTALLMLCRYLNNTWIARISIAFNREALFIFGLHLIFLYIVIENTSGKVESWKIRLLLNLACCFAGGYIVGKLYSLLVSLIKTVGYIIKTDKSKL